MRPDVAVLSPILRGTGGSTMTSPSRNNPAASPVNGQGQSPKSPSHHVHRRALSGPTRSQSEEGPSAQTVPSIDAASFAHCSKRRQALGNTLDSEAEQLRARSLSLPAPSTIVYAAGPSVKVVRSRARSFCESRCMRYLFHMGEIKNYICWRETMQCGKSPMYVYYSTPR